MARKPKTTAPKPLAVSVQFNGEPLYANFAEVGATQHDFQFIFAVLPAKTRTDQMSNGVLNVDGLVKIVVPASMIPALLNAITQSKQKHEALVAMIENQNA